MFMTIIATINSAELRDFGRIMTDDESCFENPHLHTVLKVKVKSAHEPSGPHSRSLSGFRSIKRLGVLLLLLDGMLVHRKLPPSISSGFPDSLLVPFYTPGWREAL